MPIQSKEKNNRIEWIDLAKGFAILLVVAGHCFGFPENPFHLRFIRGVLFSFLMPLFFILSTTTYTLSTSNDIIIRKTEKSFKHLIVPACVLFFLQTVISVFTEWDGKSINLFITKTINTFVYFSGHRVKIGSEKIPAIGMLWFFIVLFLGRILYDYLRLKLSKKRFIIVICLLSIIGVSVGRLQYLPLSFDVVLAVLPLFAIGEYLKHIDLKKHLLIYSIISLSIWSVTYGIEFFLTDNYLEFALRTYPLYPFCFVTAVSGVIFVSCFSILLLRIRKIMIPFIFIGKYSMYFFWAHIMDYILLSVWGYATHPLEAIALRLFADFILFGAIICSVKFGKYLIKLIKEKKNPAT